MNKCLSCGLIKEKGKEEIILSQSSLRDSKPKREKHLFSTQLISQERNPATKINYFEGSGLEWLVHKRTIFFVFWQRAGFWEGEGNNLLVHACGANSLFLFSFLSQFFRFFSYLSFFFFLLCYSLFLFLGFQVLNPILFLIVLPTVHSKGSFL